MAQNWFQLYGNTVFWACNPMQEEAKCSNNCRVREYSNGKSIQKQNISENKTFL